MTNMYHYQDAIKISWVKKFVDSENKGKWKLLFDNDIKKIGDIWIWQCEPSSVCDMNLDLNRIKNCFLKDTIKGWIKLRKQYDVVDKIIWYNSKIKVGQKTVFYRNWSKNNINLLSYLIDCDHLMNFAEFKEKYPFVQTKFVEYNGIVESKNLKRILYQAFYFTFNGP